MYKGIVFNKDTKEVCYIIENVSSITQNLVEGSNMIIENIDLDILDFIIIEETEIIIEIGKVLPEVLVDVKQTLFDRNNEKNLKIQLLTEQVASLNIAMAQILGV